LGEFTKEKVRALADELDLPAARRPDSQDVCFKNPGECCGETLRRLANMPVKTGYFLYRGKIVGHHSGIHRYTIGQRSGLGVALGVPAYIQSIDAYSGDITLETDPLATTAERFFLDDAVLHEALPERAQIRVRYRSRPVPCSLTREGNRIAVTPEETLFAVAPGQSGVLYAGNLLLGGGVISLV
ncbi:MAG: hypothetical protein MJ016_08545, partial [Victivallaceae bacterium]|nr:hypothetical protein [Victivallaceae bacterium]